MAPKCIVIGSLNGQIRPVFTKLAKLQPKQDFSFAIILGDLFGDGSTEDELQDITALIQGNIAVACPTYFTLGNRPLPPQVVEKIEATDEVCPNLFFLGKRGTLKTTDGIRIVALGGTMGEAEGRSKPESNASGKFQPTYSESDARALFGIHKTDILITNQWPKDVRLGSSCEVSGDKETVPAELQCVADVCATLKPRYHFSRSDAAFFEREPFFHMPTEEGQDAYPLTRFISLPTFGSTKNAIYAFTLDPTAPFPSSIPPGSTICPWSAAQSRRKMLPSQNESYQRYAPSDRDRDPGHQRRHKERAPPPGPENCFFCLSNPNIATHLITSIGNDSYMTTAKGPLPSSNFYPSLGFPGHMLIIPFEHCPTIDLIFDPATRASTFAEMQRYRESLHQMLNERSGGKLGAVTWEVSRSNGIHTHWQFLPMPVEKIRSRLVEMAFKKEASNLEYSTFKTVPNPDEMHNHHMIDYFRVFIWTPTPTPSTETEAEPDNWSAPEHKGVWKTESGEENVIIMKILPENRFDLQFGRRVMGKVLYLDDRINWKDCVQTDEEETVDADAFKEAFKKHDFAMETEE
ncbi:hypothetical protein PENSOL_c050G04206 [Penicillium solitum]|uniref:Cwf19-like C-terminal domain-containing protein n=1 Tax=Penicillium solitum TaxID=60172 RepID=A0A1V6QR23_9EURO|nr:uncharacterized protein PENSOL_c050G04206 [Penicillium solitum]OQD91668.1 hypothetical protein PENSOL_c050G04206 [Penicillium solitum]